MKKRYAALIFCAIGLLLGSVTSEAKKKPSVTAESAIVMDVQSGAILYEKNIDKREYPASITKVMTALVAIVGDGYLFKKCCDKFGVGCF